jgi:L-lactate dehydrogenase (cytochrome)
VYDVTNLIDSHPGGSKVILKYAGSDATEAFEPYHPSDTLKKYMKPAQNLGHVSGPAISTDIISVQGKSGTEESDVAPKQKKKKMNLSSVINITDFQKAASLSLPPKSYACKSSC